MRYFGKRSLSSVMSTILKVSWFAVLGAAVAAPFVLALVIFFSTPAGDQVRANHAQGNSPCMAGSTIHPKDLAMTDRDQRDWQKFKVLPLALKLLVIPYVAAVFTLMLLILRKARRLFDNFRNDVVFHLQNVAIMRPLAKLTIVFSIMTLSMSSLLMSIVLFLGCEIIKNGAKLQEEHDLTI